MNICITQIHSELSQLNNEANELMGEIMKSWEEIG